jgi:hypothetical protein
MNNINTTTNTNTTNTSNTSNTSINTTSLVLNNITIEARSSDNFINATQLCKAGVKKFSHWISLDSTKELIKELEQSLDADIPTCKTLIYTSKSKYKGSWIHPDLAVQLAQWISPKFAIQVSRWIRELMLTGSVSVDSKKTDEELLKLQNELKQKETALQEKTAELEKSKQKMIRLNDFITSTKELKKDEIFYIATTDLYARNNRFEYGGVSSGKDLQGRLNAYNTGRAEGDLYYYTKIIKCHKYKHIESCLNMLIYDNFKDKLKSRKEMVHMRYDCFLELVEFIVENHNADINFINQNAERFLNHTVEADPIIPDPIDLKDYIVIKRSKAGTESDIQKIDVSGWTEDDINDLIKRLINQYAATKLGEDYDFDTQKNTHQLQLVWKEFQQYLDSYEGKNKIGWRDHIKSVIRDAQKLIIKWRS